MNINHSTCSACGAPDPHVIRGNYPYKESGLDNITLKNIELIQCEVCGNIDPVISSIDGVHSLIATALIAKPARLTGKEFRFLRKHLEFSAREFAKILHVDPATISKWENGQDPVGPQSDLLIRALVAAHKEGNMDRLIERLRRLDCNESALDILINADINEFEYT